MQMFLVEKWNFNSNIRKMFSTPTSFPVVGAVVGPVSLKWEVTLDPELLPLVRQKRFVLKVKLLTIEGHHADMDIKAESKLDLTFDIKRINNKTRFHISNESKCLTNPETVWEFTSPNLALVANLAEKVDLKVFFELTVHVLEKPCRVFATPAAKLSEDFGNLLESSDYFDVILVVEGKELKAHKAVICSRSLVFKAMFSTNMNEKRENRVVMPETKCETVEAMLKFMYTGHLEDFSAVPELYENIFVLADQYAVADLKEQVVQRLGTGITAENYVHRLFLAHRHNEPILEAKCLNFIRESLIF